MRKIQAKFIVVFCTSLLILSTLIVGVGALRTFEDAEKNIVQVRISDGTDLSELNRFDMEILERYESFVLIEGDQKTIEEIEDTGMEVNRLPNRTQITVKGHTFDIGDGPNLDPDLMVDGYEEGTEGLHVVHMLGPVHPEWRFTLEEKGVDIVNYVPNHAYEVSMTPETAEDVRELDFVDWVGIYHPEFKLHSRLDEALEEDMTVNLRLRPGFERSTLLEIKSEFEVHSFEDLREDDYRLVLDINSMEELEDVARMNDVYFISPHIEPELHGEMDSQLIGGGAWFMDDEYDHLGGAHREGDPDRPYRKHGDHGAYINQVGYTGEGVTIAVADTGIGDGTIGDAGHPDLTGRVVGGYGFGDDEEWHDGHGHGTHVTGSAAGDTYGGTGETFDFGDYYIAQGLAYESEIFATKIFSDGGSFLPDVYYPVVEEPAQRSDAYIHSNSWGSDSRGAYTAPDETFDHSVRDADISKEENRPMVITSSAGNFGGIGGDESTGSPGNAKNVITVGATHTYNPDDFYGNAEIVSDFSSRGWTEDNRVKPDVVAPGEGIYSLFPGGRYAVVSGTSMSNPAVAGAASVVVEWYEENYGKTPSPAMVRSILINTATDLDSVGNTRGHIPNRDEGWGIADISKLEYPKEQPLDFRTEDQETLLETGEMQKHSIVPADYSEPLRVTLTWTDKNAMEGDSEGGTPTLKNNLDLEVETPSGEVIRGNAFDISGDGRSDDGFTHPDAEVIDDFDFNGDGWDDRNNVQNVYIHPDAVESGAYEVRVKGTEIPADSNNDGIPNQDFALTAHNTAPSLSGDIITTNERYATEDTVDLMVRDSNLGDRVEVEVGVHSDTDPTGFNVTLEGERERFYFTGEVDISESGGTKTLEVSHGDTITVEYWNEDTGDGTGAMKTDTAYVDGLPPGEPPTQLDVRWESGRDEHNLLTWTSSKYDQDAPFDDPNGHVARYDIYRSERRDGPWNRTNLIGSVIADRSEHYSYVDQHRGRVDGNRWWYVVRAVKDVGNMEMNEVMVPEPGGPEVSILSPEEDTIFTVEDVTVEWEGAEDIGNYEVRLNYGDRIEVGTATEHTFENVSEGAHMVSIFGYDDTTGEVGYDSVSFMVDLTPPVLDITSPEDESYITENIATIEWEGYDDGSGIDRYEVKINDGDWIDVNKDTSFTLADLEHAENYTVEVKAIDRAGRETIKSTTFTVDVVSPEIEIIFPEDDGWGGINMTAEWYGEDKVSGIDNYEVRLDGGEWIDVGDVTEHEFTDLSVEEHTLEVRAWDHAGNFEIASTTFDIDVYPPQIEIVSPSEDFTFDTEKARVAWIGADDYSGLSHIEVRLGEDEWINVGRSSRYTFKDLEEGTHTVAVRATDNVYQQSYDEVTFTIDKTPPQLSITSPEEDALYDEEDVEVEWKSDDHFNDIELYEVRIDQGEWIDVGRHTRYIVEDLDDGSRTVYVRATNAAGHTSTETVGFTVDTTLPKLQLLSPEDNEHIPTDEVMVTWESGDDISGISHQEIRLNGDDWIDVTESSFYRFQGLEDGDYTVEMRVEDEAGNSAQDEVSFTVDTTPPALEITSPDAGETVDSDEVTVKWESTDEISEMELYEVRIDGGYWADVGLDESHVFEGLEDGEHLVEVRGRNVAGHTSVESVEFTVDTIPPEINILSPQDGEFLAEEEVNVTWSGSDEISGIDTFKIRLDDGQWTEVGDVTHYTFDGLSEGEYIVEVMAQDEAGNTETIGHEFTVDTTPPELSITSPDEGETVDGDEVTVKWEGSDEVSGVSSYEVRLNQNEWIDVGSDTEYTFEDVYEGDNTVEIRAVDGAGNERIEELSFTVDEGIPIYWWMILGLVILGLVVPLVMKVRKEGNS